MADQLKPCPFCGIAIVTGDAEKEYVRHPASRICALSNLLMPLDVWNRRADVPPPRPEEGPTTAGPMPEVTDADVKMIQYKLTDWVENGRAITLEPRNAQRILALLEWAAGMKGGAR